MFTQTTTTVPNPMMVRLENKIISLENIVSVEIEHSFAEGNGGKIILDYQSGAKKVLGFGNDKTLNSAWEEIQAVFGFDV